MLFFSTLDSKKITLRVNGSHTQLREISPVLLSPCIAKRHFDQLRTGRSIISQLSSKSKKCVQLKDNAALWYKSKRKRRQKKNIKIHGLKIIIITKGTVECARL